MTAEYINLKFIEKIYGDHIVSFKSQHGHKYYIISEVVYNHIDDNFGMGGIVMASLEERWTKNCATNANNRS